MQETMAPEGQHCITVRDCRKMAISGVEEVQSFDEMTVILVTLCGNLTVEGEALHVARLDLERGECDIEGIVSGFFYSKTKEKNGGFFKRSKDR